MPTVVVAYCKAYIPGLSQLFKRKLSLKLPEKTIISSDYSAVDRNQQYTNRWTPLRKTEVCRVRKALAILASTPSNKL